MSITNNFKLFDTNNSNIHTDASWSDESDLANGFTAYTPAKSKNINSAIKSNSLVAIALVNALSTSYTESVTIGLDSNVNTIANVFKTALQNLSKDSVKNSSAFYVEPGIPKQSSDAVTLVLSGRLFSNTINNVNTSIYSKYADLDADGNEIKQTYASSLSVNDAIINLQNKNGLIISSVTVNNVQNAMNATNAANAENAENTSKINGIQIEKISGTLRNITDNCRIRQKQTIWSGNFSIPTDTTTELSLDISNGDKLEILADYFDAGNVRNYFKGYMEAYNGSGCNVSMIETSTANCNIRSFKVVYQNSKLKIFGPCSALYGSGSSSWTLIATPNIHLLEISKIIE